MTVPLPIPDDPAIPQLVEFWPTFVSQQPPPAWPRSKWLKAMDTILRAHYPQASSRQLSLTARGLAPFYLAQGPNVP